MVENPKPLAAYDLSFSAPLVQVRGQGAEAVVRKDTHDGLFWLHYTHGQGTSTARFRSSSSCGFLAIQSDACFYLAGHIPGYAESVDVITDAREKMPVAFGHGLWCAVGPVSEYAIVRYLDQSGNCVGEVRNTFGSWPQPTHTSWVRRVLGRYFGMPRGRHTFVSRNSRPKNGWWHRFSGR